VPLLYHRHTYRDSGYRNLYVLPYYTSSERMAAGGEEDIHLLFPLYYSRTAPESVQRFILWYYYESRPKYRYDTVPLLFARTDDLENDTYAWHFALAAGYKRYKESGTLHHRLLPLWWYSRDGQNTAIYLPFLLSMFDSRDEGNRIFRTILLGIVYYQNTDLVAYDQTLGVLLGSLYYHNKYPERKFDSYGTLYGLLWHYETEDNYKRFSILTFIYSRTEKDQTVRHKFFGISL
jgi:hypothetical protein